MAEGVQIPFEGFNKDLKDSLTEVRDLLVEVRDASRDAQAGVQKDAQANVVAQERFNQALEGSITVVLGCSVGPV